jgi:thioredoxin 1
MPPETPLTVICLCADWCGTCRDYREVFDTLEARWPSHRFVWVDIEDEAELVGDLDIETFPTLVVSAGGGLVFAGPVLPRQADAERLLDSLTEGRRAGAAAPAARLPADQHALYASMAQALDAGAD